MFEIIKTGQRVFDALKDLGVDFHIFDHPPIRTGGDAFILPEEVEGGICKNLFLLNNKGTNHYLVILDWKLGVISRSWPGSRMRRG